MLPLTNFWHNISIAQLPKVFRDTLQIPYIQTTPLPINTDQHHSVILHHIPQKTFSKKQAIDMDVYNIPENSYPETVVCMNLNYDKFKRLPVLNMISPSIIGADKLIFK
jgi:hypothetical protein